MNKLQESESGMEKNVICHSNATKSNKEYCAYCLLLNLQLYKKVKKGKFDKFGSKGVTIGLKVESN